MSGGYATVGDAISALDDGVTDLDATTTAIVDALCEETIRALAAASVRQRVRNRRNAAAFMSARDAEPKRTSAVAPPGRRWPASVGLYREFLSRPIRVGDATHRLGDMTVGDLEKAISESLDRIDAIRTDANMFRRLINAIEAAGVETVAELQPSVLGATIR
jgi:hypothetical protein